jgi:WD40 repeat protein
MQLDFTRDGRFLISVGLDDSHTAGMPEVIFCACSLITTVAVLYDWRAGVALCQANAHMSDVHTCRFNPYSPGNEFVSVGNKHVKFWNGETLEGANGLFGKVGTTQQILCVAFLPSGQTVTGQLDGSIYVWEGGAIVAKFDKAHAHGVIGILYCPLGLVTVGCDSQIKVHFHIQLNSPLSQDMTQTLVFRFGIQSPANASATWTSGHMQKKA